jgi:hypothetical protein
MGTGEAPVSDNLDSIRREARQRRGEATLQIASKDSVTIRLGMRDTESPEYFIEVVVPLCQDGCIDLDKLGHLLGVLRVLESLEYSLECSDSVVSCEKVVKEKQIDSELGLLQEKIEEL